MDTKDGLTAWEAIERLFPEPEPEPEPPTIGQAHMIKSDIELWSGGHTWVDAEYDERLGEALRPRPVPPDFLGLLREDSWYATGYRVPVDPTARRERIRPGLWDILGLDPDDNTASGGGLEYEGLRFYEKKKVGKPTRPEPVTYGDLKRFMRKRITDLKKAGEKSNAREDETAAREHFENRSINRQWIKELRQEYAPEEWSRHGRVIKPGN